MKMGDMKMWGPEMAPHTPPTLARPGSAGALARPPA